MKTHSIISMFFDTLPNTSSFSFNEKVLYIAAGIGIAAILLSLLGSAVSLIFGLRVAPDRVTWDGVVIRTKGFQASNPELVSGRAASDLTGYLKANDWKADNNPLRSFDFWTALENRTGRTIPDGAIAIEVGAKPPLPIRTKLPDDWPAIEFLNEADKQERERKIREVEKLKKEWKLSEYRP